MTIPENSRARDPLTPRETAREYRMKLAPLKEAIEAGRVPHVKIGRATYLIRSVFERWLESEAEASRRTV
jgi:hypothetical protein